jgi:hypothetical protein
MVEYPTMEGQMQKGTKHNRESIKKLQEAYRRVRMSTDTVEGEESSPITRDGVIAWLADLDDNDFLVFIKEHVITRFKKIKK